VLGGGGGGLVGDVSKPTSVGEGMERKTVKGLRSKETHLAGFGEGRFIEGRDWRRKQVYLQGPAREMSNAIS